MSLQKLKNNLKERQMANLVGVFRLGQDAVLKQTATGQTVMELSVVYNYGKKDENNSQWIKASMWGDRANKVAEYLTKGSQIYAVLSEPHVETYTTKDGKHGANLVARLDNFEFVGGKSEPKSEPKAVQEDDGDVPF
jgi:single-strand DNA-binding protein